MSILALDPSLTATGWARSDGTSGVFTPPKAFERGVDRLRWHRWAVTRVLAGIELVVLEGYAFGRPNQAHQLGELGGVIRCAVADHNIPLLAIPPKSVKLFATGNGAAKKEAMLIAAIQKLDYAGNDHNEADALWILDMAAAHYHGRPWGKDLDAKACEAMAAIQWPDIPALSALKMCNHAPGFHEALIARSVGA